MSRANESRASQKFSDRQRAASQKAKAEKAARLDFVNLDDAWKILSDKRRAILQVMVGQGELTIREIARRVEFLERGVCFECRSGAHSFMDRDRREKQIFEAMIQSPKTSLTHNAVLSYHQT